MRPYKPRSRVAVGAGPKKIPHYSMVPEFRVKDRGSSLPANGIGVYFHPCNKEEVSAPGVSPIQVVTATPKIHKSNHTSTYTPD